MGNATPTLCPLLPTKMGGFQRHPSISI